MIHRISCHAGHLLSVSVPWWRPKDKALALARAKCHRCAVVASFPFLETAPQARSRSSDEPDYVAPVWSSQSLASRAMTYEEANTFTSGGGGNFDGGGASGRWPLEPDVYQPDWHKQEAAATNEIAPAPSPTYDPPACAPAPSYEAPSPSPSDSGSCSSSDSGSSSSSSSD